MLDVMDSPGKGEAATSLARLFFFFRHLQGFSFGDVHPDVYICYRLMSSCL